MKKLIILTMAFLLIDSVSQAKYPVGISLSILKTPSAEGLAQIKASGVDHVEVVFNYFWRNVPENECYTRAYRVKALLEEAGLKSLVLPPAVQPPARHLGSRSGAARTERRAPWSG